MYDVDGDITVVQKMLGTDTVILELLELTDKPITEIAKKIIKRSQWNNLVDNEKRLCVYHLPSRSTGNEILFEEIFEVDCHVPADHDFIARKIIGRVVDTLKIQKINGRYITFKGQLGELPTMNGFYCYGVRFSYFNPI